MIDNVFYICMLFHLYFDCMYSNKKKLLFQSQKLIPSKKNQSFSIAKVSSRKTRRIKNLVSHGIIKLLVLYYIMS